MPQSLSAVYIHLVFSTKERRPFLRDEAIRDSLHSQIGGISKKLGRAPIITGGVEDHAHLLARLGRTITQAEWVKELKRVSNLWLKEKHSIGDFEWQGGYADFSVSASNLETVKKYIANQHHHHRKMNFKDELRTLLRRHEVIGTSVTFGLDATALRLNLITSILPNVAAAATLGWRS